MNTRPAERHVADTMCTIKTYLLVYEAILSSVLNGVIGKRVELSTSNGDHR